MQTITHSKVQHIPSRGQSAITFKTIALRLVSAIQYMRYI